MSNTRIQLALDNWNEYVSHLATMPDRELEKKLELVNMQSEIAERSKNTESFELLDIWHRQIVEARILKAENNIPDAPKEIELAIADIETSVAKAEERQEFVDEFPPMKTRKKVKEDNNNQTSLF